MTSGTSKNFKTEEPCICCGIVTEGGNTFHHIYTRKAYPEHTHKPWNRIPTCGNHHVPWFHDKGLSATVKEFPGVGLWLIRHEWELNAYGDWEHAHG